MPRTPPWRRELDELRALIENEIQGNRDMEAICLETPKKLGALETDLLSLRSRFIRVEAQVKEIASRERKR